MIITIPITEPNEDGKFQAYQLTTDSMSKRKNKQIVKDFLLAQGVPATHLKKTMKAMNLWDNLGTVK